MLAGVSQTLSLPVFPPQFLGYVTEIANNNLIKIARRCETL